MAKNITITFDAKNLIQDINDFANRIIPEAVQAGLNAIGDDVIIGAKEIVPVRTGRLRDSITVLERGQDHIIVGSRLEYSGAVEYGTAGRPPKPYIGPQADKMQEAGGKIIEDEIARRIKH